MSVIAERLEALKTIKLQNGAHDSFEDGMCAMEAAAYIAGEPHTDHPACACPVITAFMISWNDSISDTEERTRLLSPLIPLTVGTRSTKEIENRRVWLCMDWSIRTFTPEWLDLCGERYAANTRLLREFPEIVSEQGLIDAIPALVDLKKQSAAAWAVARVAARAAAWDAARAAAWAAARAAAWAVARVAARDAAWDAAWVAARAAARAAAWAVARDALVPTKEKLQASAANLVKRMCETPAP